MTRPGRLLLGAALTVAVALPVQYGRAEPAPSPGGAAPLVLPELGVADRGTTMLGAVTRDGAPGETWAYRRLPLDGGPATFGGRPLVTGAAGSGAALPQLAFLRFTDDDGWQVAQTPVDEQGRPYRGPDPNPRSARLTPRGGGVLAGQDGGRPADRQVVLLRRNPGDVFRALSAPPADVLLGQDDPAPGDPPEVLARDRGAGEIQVAAADDGSRTRIFVVPLGRPVQGAVLSNDGTETPSGWTREPIELGEDTRFAVAGIAAADAAHVFLAASSPGRPVRLFRRDTSGSGPAWTEVPLPAGPLTNPGEAADAGISGLALLDGQAQTVTGTPDGAWLDVRLTTPSGRVDATLFVDTSDGAPTIESWCDLSVCDHPLGAAFSTTTGYRSFAWPGAGAGARVITNPLRPGGDEESSQGVYLRLTGDRFERVPGAGYVLAPSGAFSGPDRGWLEGPVQVGAAPPPHRLGQWPVALRAPLTAATGAPGTAPGDLGSAALAVGSGGAVARYTPGAGWAPEFLLSPNGSVVASDLRGVAWPEAGRAHAVGDLGAMWLWRADTGLWERDPAAPVGFQGNLMGVAFDAADPQRGYAVGKDGVLLRYDKTWTQTPLPEGFADADFTSVAFAGREAIAVSDKGVLVDDGSGWKADDGVRQLLAGLPAGAAPLLVTAAGLPDGGAVIGGRDMVLERDAADAPWRFAAQPPLGQTVIAAAAFRDGASVRALISTAPGTTFPAPDPAIEPDPNSPTPLLPPFRPAGDGYLLRETRSGWRDELRTAFGGAGEDRPLKSDPIVALVTGGAGDGWAIGGWTGDADSAGRGTSARGPAAAAARRRVQTAGIYRYAPDGSPAEPPGAASAPVALTPGVVRFAVGGHAQCMAPCAALANQQIGPDRMLTSALDLAAGLARSPAGPRAFLYTGGRIDPAGGDAGDAEEEARYAQLLASRPQLPVFGAVAEGDVAPDGPAAFRASFAPAPAPFGTTDAAPGISTGGIPGAPAGAGARTHFAFDTSGDGGTVRVVYLDNSNGSLAASDPHQNPAEPQLPWLVSVLTDARSEGIPVIVVGSRDLNPRAQPALNVASDGDEVARVLRDGGASAYFFDRPEENRTSAIPSGEADAIPEFGTGTLGYRSSLQNAASLGQPDALFGDAGILLAEVRASARNPDTNRAPVDVRLIPVIERLSLQALDGTLLRRSRPALFSGLGRKPVGGDRWGPPTSEVPDPAGSSPFTSLPPDQCLLPGCSSRIVPEYRFGSQDPDILDFVKQDPSSSNLRKPLLGPDDKVVSEPTSGLVCPFNAGTTTVTIAAGGLAYSAAVTVLPGSVLRPCGTRPLDPAKIKRVAPAVPAASAPPPAAPASAPTRLPALVPPPPPALAPAPRTVKVERRAAEPRTVLFGGLLGAAPPFVTQPTVIPPPPPPSFFANPVPPGGATVRVHEEKREEEIAPEQSQANAAAYRADDRLPLAPFVFGVMVIAALAGVSLRLPRRRGPAYAVNRLRYPESRDPRLRRTRP